MSLLELLQSEGYHVEFVTEYTESFIDDVVKLYEPYGRSNRTLSNNYTPDRIRQCFYHGRFDHGFVTASHKNKVVLTFGIGGVEGWAVITRYLRHDKNAFIPVGYGLALPYAIAKLSNTVKGVCSLHNIGKRDINQVILTSVYERCKKYSHIPLYKSALSLLSKTRKLPYPVLYRGTVQAVYTYNTNLIPPFKPARLVDESLQQPAIDTVSTHLDY